jgi:hypothetical protein
MSFDSDTTVLMVLGGVALMGGLLVFAVSVKLARMKIRKEIGFWKAHMKFRPRPPRKVYQIRE